MPFPKIIIDALKNIEKSAYDDEYKHFMEGITDMWSDKEENRNVDEVKDRLKVHTFYGYLVSEFLEYREMEDITDKLFEEYIHLWCLWIIEEYFN